MVFSSSLKGSRVRIWFLQLRGCSPQLCSVGTFGLPALKQWEKGEAGNLSSLQILPPANNKFINGKQNTDLRLACGGNWLWLVLSQLRLKLHRWSSGFTIQRERSREVFFCPFRQVDSFKPWLTRTSRRSTVSTSDDFPSGPLPTPYHLLLPKTWVFLPHRDLLIKCRHRANFSLYLNIRQHGMAVGHSVHSLSQRQNRERSSQGQLTNRYKAKETERQKFRGQSPIKMEKGVKMLPNCRASKCMEPSVQSLSHSWI